MIKKNLLELLSEVYDLDEVRILSPGGRMLEVTGINLKATNELGIVCLDSEWLRNEKEAPAEEEPKKPAKAATKKTPAKRGRPRKNAKK